MSLLPTPGGRWIVYCEVTARWNPCPPNTLDQNYQSHLKLNGFEPKSIDAYAEAISRLSKREGSNADWDTQLSCDRSPQAGGRDISVQKMTSRRVSNREA